MKRLIPLIITAVVGLLYIFSDGIAAMNPVRIQLDRWNNISTGFAILLACFSLTVVHVRYLRRPESRVYSAILLGSMYGMILLGLVVGRQHPLYSTIFNNTAGVLEGVVLSSVCFYVVSVTYRSFRLRSVESAIMLVSAVFVMLANVSIGEIISDAIPAFGLWLTAVPNSAAMRAITVGAALGAAATAIRVLAGVERTYLGGE